MTSASGNAAGPGTPASRLQQARAAAGLPLEAAAAAASLDSALLDDLERGRRRPRPAELERLSAAYGVDLSDVLPPRRPVEYDRGTGLLVLDGVRQRRVKEAAGEGVHVAYLALLYTVRGARPGQPIRLRTSDVEALIAVVGDDPAHMEQRLVELMGSTREEASLLRRLLVRHRPCPASAGVVAGLSLAAVVGLHAVADGPAAADASVTAEAGSGPALEPGDVEISGANTFVTRHPDPDSGTAEQALLDEPGSTPPGE